MLAWSQFTQGHNSIKTVNAVMELNLCTSPDDALFKVSRKYLKGFQSFKKISQRISELLRGCGLYTEIFKGA